MHLAWKKCTLKKLQVGERIIGIAVRLKSEWTAKLVSETPEYPNQQKQVGCSKYKIKNACTGLQLNMAACSMIVTCLSSSKALELWWAKLLLLNIHISRCDDELISSLPDLNKIILVQTHWRSFNLNLLLYAFKICIFCRTQTQPNTNICPASTNWGGILQDGIYVSNTV